MKYISHFIKYSILFFVVFEIFFALTVYFSFGFDFDLILKDTLLVNVFRTVFCSLISIGCGLYSASYLIYHNKQMSVAFFVAVFFGLLLAKGLSGSYILSRAITPTVGLNLAYIIFLFIVSSVLLVFAIVSQIKQNIHFYQVKDKKTIKEDGSSSLFM